MGKFENVLVVMPFFFFEELLMTAKQVRWIPSGGKECLESIWELYRFRRKLKWTESGNEKRAEKGLRSDAGYFYTSPPTHLSGPLPLRLLIGCCDTSFCTISVKDKKFSYHTC